MFRTILLTVVLLAAPSALGKHHGQAAPAPVDRAEFESWMEKISNWNRWGKDDQLGTLNLITPAKRLEAIALVKEGVTVSLALDLNTKADAINTSPFSHKLTLSEFAGHQVAGDDYAMSYHGFAHSHMDGLPHFFHKGKMYNGYSVDEVKSDGSRKLGIHNAKDGVVSRGILVDMPAFKGVPYLEPGTAITVADLEAWERENKIRIGSGDVMLLRTGRWQRQREKGQWNFLEKAAGLHASVALWLKERDVAVIGCDGVSDVMPANVAGLANPLHELVLVGLGMPILDNLDLGPLAEAAHKRKQYTFLFMGSPLRVVGGTGSPMNPLVMF
jgi:kynurenine formamidase